MMMSGFEGLGIALLIPLVATMMHTPLPASTPGLIRAITDVLLTGHDRPILAIGLAILALIALKGAAQVLIMVVIGLVDTRISHDVRTALIGRLLGIDYEYLLVQDRSHLVKVVSTDTWAGLEVIRVHFEALVALSRVVVFAALLLMLDWKLFGVVTVTGLAFRFVHGRLAQRVREHGNLSATILKRLTQQILTVINSARTIRVFGQQEAEQRRFDQASAEISSAFFDIYKASAWTVPLIELLVASLFVVIVVTSNSLGWSIATLTAFLALLYRMQPSLSALAQARVRIASRQGILADIEAVLTSESGDGVGGRAESHSAGAELDSIDQTISFEDVSYVYPNGAEGLRRMNIKLAPSTITALIGPSGAGKSTVVNLLARLIEPSAGRILLGERPVEEVELHSWRERIALAGQDIELVAGSVSFNIAYGHPEADRSAIEAAARAANAHQFILALPAGYDTYVGEGGLSLSGGQRQRIGLARAFLRKPDLLILDEATSAIDALSEAEVLAMLERREFFSTALVISHRRSTIACCDFGIVLQDGCVAEAGPLDELKYVREMGLF